MAGSGVRHPDLEKLVAESVAKSLPAVLPGVVTSLSLQGQNEPKDNVNTVTKSTEGIPADKHLFPDKFRAKIKSEHDRSLTNSKLISTPASKHFSKGPHKREQPFRGNYPTTYNSRVGGKRKCGYGSRSNCSPLKGPEQQDPPPSNLTPRTARADYLFPCLKVLTPPTNGSATHLQFFVQNWKQITQDTWTLQTIQGYKIPLYRRPRQWRMRVTRVKCHSDAHHMEMAIKDLLSKGAVREVQPTDDQFTPTLFLVQKENGDYRPIINLRALNRFLEKESFKMEGLQVAKSLIQQVDFMMKLDLKDAYYAIPIHHSHRKYLRFIYQDRT